MTKKKALEPVEVENLCVSHECKTFEKVRPGSDAAGVCDPGSVYRTNEQKID